MNIYMQDIGVSVGKPILFSHMVDVPDLTQHRLHLHDYTELFIYVSGAVDFLLDNAYIHLNQGDVVLARENVLHRPLVRSRSLYERFFIGLPADAFAALDTGGDPLAFLQKDGALLTLDEAQYGELLHLLRRMHRKIEEQAPHYVLYADLLRVMELLNAAEVGHHRRAAGSDAAALVSQVLEYLDAGAGETDSVQAVADRFHVNVSYLSAVFHTHAGVTLKQYITAKKIAVAKAMLSRGETVTDTAFACRFSSASHFIAVFRRLVGVTPGAYRSEKYGE